MKHVISLLIGVGWGIIAFTVLATLMVSLIQLMRPAHADEYQYNDAAYSQVSNVMQDMLIINISDTDRIASVEVTINAGTNDGCAESNYLLTAMRQLVDAKIAEDPSRAHYYDTAIESIDRAWCKQ